MKNIKVSRDGRILSIEQQPKKEQKKTEEKNWNKEKTYRAKKSKLNIYDACWLLLSEWKVNAVWHSYDFPSPSFPHAALWHMNNSDSNQRMQRLVRFHFWWILNTILITDEEWEKDLAAEDFEVVDDQNVDESDLDLDLK